MVKHEPQIATLDDWLDEVGKTRSQDDVNSLKNAISFAQQKNPALLTKSLIHANILLSLELDTETLVVAFLYAQFYQSDLNPEILIDEFGESAKKLLVNTLRISSLSRTSLRGDQQAENLRKMLLAMVTDVRAVLIILAERVCQLRLAKALTLEEQKKLAAETRAIYAPLANRLGVWQLKWEMEDLCLRYLEQETYKKIANALAEKRTERQAYIVKTVDVLKQLIKPLNLKQYEVNGRVKHIYSIYAKMKRKDTSFEEIYDISAFRILVPEIEDCYAVLSALQNAWERIPKEFDDYISQPKANNYRSIHTVLIGPENKIIEVQIRTFQMHQESELGVASHWRYKEGGAKPSNYEAKIALLRQIMAWEKDIINPDEDNKNTPNSPAPLKDLFADSVYVFTPMGDVIELPQGSTPLDFAYHIHSEIGHRCRGAKVDKKMVTLTTPLQTGNLVEILTTKEPNPSRDWLNPQLGYLKSPRARSHLAHWFRVVDSEVKIFKDKEIIPKENKKPKLLITNREDPVVNTQLIGIDNMLSKIARCCKPLPGDDVVGYITTKAGLSIHRRDCSNISYLQNTHTQRFIDININEKFTGSYPVDLEIQASNYPGLLRDVTTTLAAEDVSIVGVRTYAAVESLQAVILLTVSVSSIKALDRVIAILQKIPSINHVKQSRYLKKQQS